MISAAQSKNIEILNLILGNSTLSVFNDIFNASPVRGYFEAMQWIEIEPNVTTAQELYDKGQFRRLVGDFEVGRDYVSRLFAWNDKIPAPSLGYCIYSVDKNGIVSLVASFLVIDAKKESVR